MKLDVDPAKNERNIRKRGLPFDGVYQFDFDTALIQPDFRFDYPEPRFIATGFIGERLHVVCYTPVGDSIRVISFRKANEREARKYVLEREGP